MLAEGLIDNISLFNLNLSRNDITVSGIEALAQVLPTTLLEELDLSVNPLGNVGIAQLANSLNTTRKNKQGGFLRCNLKELNISECSFQYSSAFKLFNALKDYRELKTLILDKNYFAAKDGMKMSALKEVLFRTRIEKLSINDCHLGEEGGKAVGEALQEDRTCVL